MRRIHIDVTPHGLFPPGVGLNTVLGAPRRDAGAAQPSHIIDFISVHLPLWATFLLTLVPEPFLTLRYNQERNTSSVVCGGQKPSL